MIWRKTWRLALFTLCSCVMTPRPRAEEPQRYNELTSVDMQIILTAILIEWERGVYGKIQTDSLCYEHRDLCKQLRSK